MEHVACREFLPNINIASCKVEDMERPRKRKKKSFLQKARKFSKMGFHGKGTHVDEETYSYFLKILEMKIETIENVDEKGTIANNALKQTEGQEVMMSMNQLTSRVIESLLPYAENDVLIRFIGAYSDLRRLCTDNLSSFVVQTLTKVCADKFRENGNTQLRDFVLKISSFVFNNLEEFIYDPRANQIGRTCLKECAGHDGREGLAPNIVENLGKRVLKWPQIKDMALEPLTSAFIQCLLQCLSVVNLKLSQKVVKQLVEECFLCASCDADDTKKLADVVISPLFQSKPLTHLLEAAIQVATGKAFCKIYTNIFLNRMAVLSCDPLAFLAVQKLILNCSEPSELNLFADELTPALPKLIDAERLDVINELAKACSRLGVKEGDFLKGLKDALGVAHCVRGELVMKLIFFPDADETKPVNKNGSLLLQTLFSFKKPISIVDSLLAVDTKSLKKIFMDPKGSYIADAFVKSRTIGEKSRERLIQKMKDHYMDLGVDKFGSRVIEAFWSRATMKEKHLIMGEFNRSLSKTSPGTILAVKLKLDLYLSDKAKWVSKESADPTKIFSDILK